MSDAMPLVPDVEHVTISLNDDGSFRAEGRVAGESVAVNRLDSGDTVTFRLHHRGQHIDAAGMVDEAIDETNVIFVSVKTTEKKVFRADESEP